VQAHGNNLRLNPTKTKVMLVSRRGKIRPPTSGIVQGTKVVDSMSIVGVTITSDLKSEQHLCKTLSSAALSMFAVGTLRNHWPIGLQAYYIGLRY